MKCFSGMVQVVQILNKLLMEIMDFQLTTFQKIKMSKTFGVGQYTLPNKLIIHVLIMVIMIKNQDARLFYTLRCWLVIRTRCNLNKMVKSRFVMRV